MWSAIEDVLQRLAGIDPGLAAVALVFHLANHVLRSLAWRSVLAAAYPHMHVPFVKIASAYAAGVALNAVAPARGGDAVKVGLARAALPGSGLTCIAATMSVLVLFDSVAATVIVLVAGLSGIVPISAPSPGTGQVLLIAGGVAVAVAILWLAHRMIGARVRAVWAGVRRGGAILATPRRYLLAVVLPQSGAWCCRVAVIVCLLAAFGLPASVPLAGVVMVLTGASTLVPLTPGGAGTQQVVLAVALSETASAAAIVSFSLGMQAGVTLVNALLGVIAAMTLVRTVHPVVAVRAARRLLPARAPARQAS